MPAGTAPASAAPIPASPPTAHARRRATRRATARAIPRRGARAGGPTDAYSNSPTAANESQKPGVSVAHGSHSSTPASAHSHTMPAVPGTAQPQAARGDDQHRERAHRGNAGARQQHVATRRDDTDHGSQLARGNARRQAHAAPGKRIGDAAGEGREHRDVQSGDADQVGDAGAVEHRPLRLGNRALIADRKRHDHAGVRAHRPAPRRSVRECARAPAARSRRDVRRRSRGARSGLPDARSRSRAIPAATARLRDRIRRD